MKSISASVLALSFLMVATFARAGGDTQEKVAVAANGQTPTAAVGQQLGRSPFFLIFDEKGTFVQRLENPYAKGQAAGISIVNFLAGTGVTVLVAESYGPRIVEVMKSKGIRAVTFTGTAADAVKKVVSAK